ncbi:uncharacterized protein C8Q71DRAFT_850923 [Rhodofomes roseus]|uniref:Uncharacterized protein n=1 Tax=Rhodofomes roseus TaxID=34475 RepID=A0ABQ8K4C0_9APHY|nr:uncharacterized protein C8Q71DRAFT_850923 [Rhodofomes roseus]KAH9831221.1 hypothetical protein C8Q71DRAFT_850923 [Rhodofomes roseus]
MAPFRVSYVPQLPWELSFSPLLAGGAPPSTSPRLPLSPRIDSAQSSPRLPLVSSTSIERTPTRSRLKRSKLLPSPTPKPTARPSRSPILNLIKLLERMDDDISCEVQRVRESIRETRALVKEVKSEQRLRSSEFLAQRDKEDRETKGINDEFWLGV